ncbi:MAG: flagellar basal body-associated protein FliL [Rhodobacteraceae bacterium PARR1]|nr:MAG: flagellar basal body-associated protein FliL [Rhodobacteraceae bacterium PARR1]
MIARVIPLILPLIGLGAGVGAGFALRPDAPAAASSETAAETAPDTGAELTGAPPEKAADPENPPEYAKMNNQFVVPVLEGGRVVSMVILSLSIEIPAGGAEGVYAREPKLRDSFLQVLFDHANAGGFRGSFTDGSNMVLLRRALLESARAVLGDAARDVLITDIVRQDS